ncbi:hypothetical protein QJS10_CPA09g00525 [Acorus calamus]|uniref:Bifunctional inhibitor/plant lipid transfer protein/seed storage helical domain-containing protein n=1 Tax=Acorus calamus TaxID=4465 RepID=A0AAV9E4B6_ACOCL|nr:hypothetical protein QJS10_CPA09g00525 [Acorus calamus]
MKASQCLLLLVLVTACATLSAASSGGDDCDSVIYTMLPCLSFVENGSKVAKPDADCCSAFSKLVKTHPGCLCEAMNAGSTFGIPINMTKALTLPKACGVKVHHKPHCGAPTPAPAPGV